MVIFNNGLLFYRIDFVTKNPDITRCQGFEVMLKA